jgi:hypothetical protein
MYGRIGAILEGEISKTGFVANSDQPETERTMVSLFMDDMVGTTESVLEDVLYIPSKVLRGTVHFITAHKILLVFLILSFTFNLFLSGRSTVAYWNQRSAERFMEKAGVRANNALIQMVSIKDIDDIVSEGLIGVNTSRDGLWYVVKILLLISNQL